MCARMQVVVNFDEQIVYCAYVRPPEKVTDFRTKYSGVRPHHMKNALPLKKVQSDEELNYEGIQKASKAAQGIYKWLIALQNYYYVYAECKPRRDALLLAEK